MTNLSIATTLRCALADLEGILPEFDPEHGHPAWQTLIELKQLVNSEERMEAADRYNPATQMAIIWSVEDVLEVRPELSEDQAMEVLLAVRDHHDATVGVSWVSLECWADDLFKRCLEKTASNREAVEFEKMTTEVTSFLCTTFPNS